MDKQANKKRGRWVKGSVVVLWLFLLPLAARTQDRIETDRPTEGLTAKTVGKGKFQLETGVRRDQQSATDYTVRHPDLEWRYGLLSRLEIRLSTIAETQRLPSEGKSAYGLLPVEVGTKFLAWQAKDSSCLVSLYGHLGLPALASADHQLDKAFYRARVLVDKDLTEKLSVQINAGRDWQSAEQKQVWVYAVSPHVDLGERWQAFVESFGYLHGSDAPAHYLGAGLAFFASRNVELDLYAGKGISQAAANHFLTAGFSFRL